MTSADSLNQPDGVAIIGMSCRFPGAKNVDEFWQNLRDGVESISFFSNQELAAEDIDPALLSDPNYVKAGAVLEGVKLFDAGFFGYFPREAEMIDPQQRLFLESAWIALEAAGYCPESYKGQIGVYAGSRVNDYLLNNLYPNGERLGLRSRPLALGDDDNLATRVSYKLNLRGPSLKVQAACSTSLVAIHLGCQALLNGECDMALAGGVALRLPEKSGYLYQEGNVASPDGHCRSFDARAQGTVFGNGVGIVVLKRLADAIKDRDNIEAVIKGSAINNDGALKIGFTAPSAEGQAWVIAEALDIAGVDPETVTYVEAHGTATPLGDPIEVIALTRAFSAGTQKKNFCAVGSVKSNIGHASAAAGVAGVIKTTLALKHKLLPPSLHFERPNPNIDFANSPFYVNTRLSDWKSTGAPRRAGISAFGIGGTNAHVVIEEAPAVEASGSSRPWQLLLLSAKTGTALETVTTHLAEYLKQHPDVNLADVAFTLQVGRKVFNHRRALVCTDLADAIQTLERADPKKILTWDRELKDGTIAFMFPGQGSQYVDMGRQLYETESVFRAHVDICAELLAPKLGLDLRRTLYPSEDRAEEASKRLNRTLVAQPALFTVEYAMAQLLMSWGIKPQAMIGHSVGEYVAACLAGVFSLEDGLALIAARGRLMDELPGGAMLAVPLAVEEVKPLLSDAIALAAHNGPGLCVLSGREEALQQLEERLRETEIECRRLHTSHAFHSQMMEPVLRPFTEEVRKIKLNTPAIPFLSNVSGNWITEAEATDANYWAKQLRQTVRFSEGLQKLLEQTDLSFIEVGPGETLSSATKLHRKNTTGDAILSSMRRPQNSESDLPVLLNVLGRLWLAGIKIDWSVFYSKEKRRRVSLPTYPFERERYWVEPQAHKNSKEPPISQSKKTDVGDWFYLPSWKRSAPKTLNDSALTDSKSSWLVFLDECGAGAQLVTRLEQLGQDVIAVNAGDQFCKMSQNLYSVNPRNRDDYDKLLRELNLSHKQLRKVLHFWSVTANDRTQSPLVSLEQSQDLGLFSLLFLAQAFGEQHIAYPVDLLIVSNHIQEVTGEELLRPEKATVLGACKVIPLEYSNMTCCGFDIVISKSAPLLAPKLMDALLGEITATPSSDTVVAYRGSHRWVQCLEPVRLDRPGGVKSRLREGGVYLMTGGLGGVGLTMAEELARTVRAKLILIGRSAFPKKDQWGQWISTHDAQDAISSKICTLQALEDLGSEVLVFSADVASEEAMQKVIDQATAQFGQIHGVVHCAGVPDYAGVIHRRSRALTSEVMAPKVMGTLVLDSILKGAELDFFVLCSSLSSIVYRMEFGQVGYCAANDFLDVYASYKSHIEKTFTVSINWCGWQKVGMAVEARKRWARMHGIAPDSAAAKEALSVSDGLSPSEATDVFQRILGSRFSRIAVSTRDLLARIEQDKDSVQSGFLKGFEKPTNSNHARPELSGAYVAPGNDAERTLVHIWQELLGFDRVGIHDNFFDLGGHSLLATRVISRVNKTFEVELSLSSLFEAPTVAEIAVVIAQNHTKKAGREEASRMLADLEALSDEEAQRLLAEENPQRN
jgi:acyl transferase domain-containing protein/acyl carrier protein